MSTENNEVIKTVENVDELFETIVVNGETFTSSKYVAPQKTEKPTVSTATTETSKEDDELLGRVTRAVQNVSAVELNDVNYPIKDENTYDKNTIDSKLEEAGKVKTVDYIAPDDNGNIALGVTSIKDLIPPQASETNKLADKNFVNSSIQTNTANFRGNWATWEAVPTEASEYPSDYAGNTTPTENDYMVVQNASSYGQAYEGTWRFKYSGNWAEVGKNGWHHEYQVNETPLTAEQLATLNSGLTATNVIKSDGANATTSGVNSMLNQLTEGTSDPQDNDYYISQYAGGGTTNITYHRRPVKCLWNYIKGKISSVLGLTSTSYGGTSNKATSVVDYGDTNRSIKIGYAGSGLETVTHLAGYGSEGTTIKDITLSNVKKAMLIPTTKVYGSMGGNVRYVTITFTDTYGGILVTTGYSSNLWFDSNKGTPYAFTTSTNYGVTGYAWSSDGRILYLRLAGYRPITVTIPSFDGDDDRVTFGELSSTAPSGVTFLTDVRTIAYNAVSYDSQTLTDAQKSQARRNIGAGTGSGTITGIKMNGASKGTSGVVDLGTVLTSDSQTLTDAQKSQARRNIGAPTLLDIYPVGAVYISVNNTNPSSLFGGTWESIGAGRVLQGADSSHIGGTTINAGLPNITGTFRIYTADKNNEVPQNTGTGAFTKTTDTTVAGESYKLQRHCPKFSFNANDGATTKGIYGNSTTVQPPAYCVYMWKRTA